MVDGYPAVVDVSEPFLNDDRLWQAAVYPGYADVLLRTLDPLMPYVLIETWDGKSEWHEATVSVGPDDEPRSRLVRRHRFDLLVSPAEAVEIGVHLSAEARDGWGGLGCFQFRRRPRSTFHLPDSPRSRADAMRGQGVELEIDLPHDGEVAVVRSPLESNLVQFMRRLA
jgi:hypothetical protein